MTNKSIVVCCVLFDIYDVVGMIRVLKCIFTVGLFVEKVFGALFFILI